MTLVSAIPATDRIVVTADGMAVDTVSGKITCVPKLFQLSENCVAAITGMGLEKPDKFMETAAFNIRQNKLSSTEDIVTYLDKLVKTRVWAENDKSFLYLIVVGYRKSGLPEIRLFLDKGLRSAAPRMYALGNWDDALSFLYDELDLKTFDLIEIREAERVAMRALVRAEKAKPKEIGEQETLWHVFPDRIEKKTKGYTDRLRKKYGKLEQ